MKDHMDAILRVLRSEDMPEDGWTASALRKLCGLSALNFSRACEQLRFAGKMEHDRIALTRAAMADAPLAAVASTLAESVEKETAALAANRKAVRSFTTLGTRLGTVDIATTRQADASLTDLSIGGRLQELALHDDHLAAANIVRTRWNDLWKRVCLHAGMTGQRPIPAMIELLEGAIDAQDYGASGGEQAA